MAVLICLSVFSGCSGKLRTVEVRTSGFSATAAVSCGEKSITADFNIGLMGDMTATVLSPKSLEGMTVKWIGDKVTLSFLGIEKETDPQSLPYFNYASCIRDALLSIGESVTARKEENGYFYEGSCAKGDYTVLFRADGFPVTLCLPFAGVEVTFSDFEYIY